MPTKYIRLLIILGGAIILGIIFSQLYWLIRTWDLKDQEFDQTVQIALRQVAGDIASYNKTELPKQNLIQRRSSNIYAVNINSTIDANILEDYLIQQFEANSINTDFEYAVYDCFADNLVYGNYCKLSDHDKAFIRSVDLPKFQDLDYYFVVKFPSRESYLINNMLTSVVFSAITALSVLFFLYTMWIILKQKKLSELQKDFINNMTHEFKTPISSIKIAADVLASSENIETDSRLKRYASIIKDQNKRLNDQVEKVLHIAKIENDSFKLNLETFNPGIVLEEIINNEALKLESGTITYFPSEGEINIHADRLHFTNVITNILDNAIKYSTDNDPEIEVKLLQHDKSMIIRVIDNGIGISKENLKRIHEKFFRVSTGNIHNVKGFGLGLFYVKNICKAHGWDIAVDSTEGKGTTVDLIIYKNGKS
ncbi:MAG: HAMP domain-containing histidine kinase [Saprospiraceae bacterium]|nr:HAMP domain-containing histidine kinase [Saprospiraceae bacterium]